MYVARQVDAGASRPRPRRMGSSGADPSNGLFEGFGSGCGEARALCNTECCKVPGAIRSPLSIHFFASHPPIPTKTFIWACVYLCVECMSCYMHILLTLHVLRSCSPVGWTVGRSSIRRVSAGGRLARLWYVKLLATTRSLYSSFHYPITTTTGRYMYPTRIHSVWGLE